MDITKLATKMLLQKITGDTAASGSGDSNIMESVLGSLLGGNSQKQGIDLGSIVSGLQNSGLSDLAESWLGKGSNASISTSQLESLLGSDKINQAASQLGANSGDLLSGLQDVLPQLIDKASPNGDLLDSVGGLSGLANLASKFLK